MLSKDTVVSSVNIDKSPITTKAIMLSIRSRYWNKIASGEKRYEYRCRVWKDRGIVRICFYVPEAKSVLGEACITFIENDDISSIWDLTHKYAGIMYDEYLQYFTGKQDAYAIHLNDVRRYAIPRPLKWYGIKHAPQSFCYFESPTVTLD